MDRPWCELLADLSRLTSRPGRPVFSFHAVWVRVAGGRRCKQTADDPAKERLLDRPPTTTPRLCRLCTLATSISRGTAALASPTHTRQHSTHSLGRVPRRSPLCKQSWAASSGLSTSRNDLALPASAFITSRPGSASTLQTRSSDSMDGRRAYKTSRSTTYAPLLPQPVVTLDGRDKRNRQGQSRPIRCRQGNPEGWCLSRGVRPCFSQH